MTAGSDSLDRVSTATASQGRSPENQGPEATAEEARHRATLDTLRDLHGLRQARKGEQLLALGADDREEILLLSGTVRLTAADGRSREVRADSLEAWRPLAQLRPSRFSIVARGPVEYLRVPPSAYEMLMAPPEHVPMEEEAPAEDYEVVELFQADDDLAQEVFEAFLIAVNRDQVRLPTLPEVALRIQRGLADEDLSIRALADLVSHDAAIAAKIVRTANSAFYRGAGEHDDVLAAVSRLGMDTTRRLVTAFSVKELYDSPSPLAAAYMRRCWQKSCDVAAIAFVLSVELHVGDPGTALLAGLLHDIGCIPLLVFSEDFPELRDDGQRLEELLARGRSDAGALLLSEWKFEEELVAAVRSADDWHRGHRGPPDYCDLVQLARAHGRSASEDFVPVPELESITAFSRFPSLTPERSREILDRAQPSLEETRQLLS